jgi:mRNA interferase MazF
MQKDFDKWNDLKKKLNDNGRVVFAHPREIWWCSLGLNIGAETDGKNENFERPVIIMKVYNKETQIVLPLATKEKCDEFHHKIITDGKVAWAKLTQTRVVSVKRLLRKLDLLSEKEFNSLKQVWKESL